MMSLQHTHLSIHTARRTRLATFAASLLACVSVAHAQCLPGTVLSEQKISSTAGSLSGSLLDEDAFGSALASLGDFDGDGVVDVAVGAPLDDDGGADRGALYICLLNADGTVKSETKISSASGGFSGSLSDEDEFGASIINLGDLDGDGVIDLAVGAPADDDGGPVSNSNHGAVWILFLNSDGTVKSEQKVSETAGGFTGDLTTADRFGTAVAGLGDIDGDGVEDLAVGATGDDDGAFAAGAIWVLFLDTDGTVLSHQKITDGSGGGPALGNFDSFGESLAVIPDMNSDGIDELAAGAPFDDDGGSNKGAVYILFLDNTGSATSTSKISTTSGGFSGGLLNSHLFGSSITALGDIDEDGVNDLAVGARQGGSVTGATWVLFMNADGTVGTQQEISDGEGDIAATIDNFDRFGQALVGLGDTDGNGIDDIMVGSPGDDDGGTDRGAIYTVRLAGMWVDNGHGLAGTNGTPHLSAVSALTAGAPITLSLSNAPPSAVATLIIGFDKLDTPLKGGVLVPTLDILLAGLPIDAAGDLALASTWPAGIPSDFSLFVQYWIPDAGGPQGLAASNGLSGTTP